MVRRRIVKCQSEVPDLTAALRVICMRGVKWLTRIGKVLLWLVVLCAAVAAFFAGAAVAKRTASPPAAALGAEIPAGQREEALGEAEKALAARFDGKHQEALEKLRDARRLDPSLKGLDYQMGLTHLHLAEFDAAELSARRSLHNGEEKSNAHALLALIALEKAKAAGRPETARETVVSNVQFSREADPLNSMPLYVLGEYYSAAGQPAEALRAYQMALERVSTSDSILISSVKAGLTGLQMDRKPDSLPYKVQEINGMRPPDQLIIAAADALLRGDKEGAAALLVEARGCIPSPIFKALLQDPLFQDYAVGDLLDVSGRSHPQP